MILPHRTRTTAAAAVLLLATGAAPGTGVAQASDGAELVAALGCDACHQGLRGSVSIRDRAPPFGPGAPPLPAEFVFTYLADPQPRRPEIAPSRMPDFRLREDERLALALFLGAEVTGEQVDEARRRHSDVTSEDGALLFRGLGCAGCHTHPDAAAPAGAVGPDLTGAGDRYLGEWLRTFLAAPVQVRPAGHRPGTGSRMPDFRLTPGEVSALGSYLESLRTEAATTDEEAPAEPTPWERSRAEDYLTRRLSCLGCHTWRGEGGRIAPPLDGLPRRIRSGEVAAMVHDPGGSRPGILMPPSPFRRTILEGVVALLASDTAEWRPAPRAEVRWEERRRFLESAADVVESPEPRGAELYVTACAQCHGATGDGGGFNAPHLPVTPTVHADGAAMSLRPDDILYDGIAAGGWVLDRSHRMPAFGARFDPDRIRSLVEYIRTLCDCVPPTWSGRGGG